MAHIRNVARDVATGDPFLTGTADILGPDGALLAAVPVNGTTGVWEYKVNGSPGLTEQQYSAADQTKIVDGSVGGQAGDWYELELPRLLQLFSSGVINAMGVTAPGGMNISVAVGNLLNLGVLHPIYTPEVVAIAAAHATLPRIDLIVSRLTRTGTFAGRLVLARVAGTAAASPAVPALTTDATTNEVEVCRVTVPAAASSIVIGNINTVARPIAIGPLSDGSVTQAKLAKPSVGTPELFDGAVTLPKLADGLIVPGLSPGFIANYWVSAHNVISGSPGQTVDQSQNVLYACPIFIPRATNLTGMAVSRTLGTASSVTGRLGLYHAGSNGLPGNLRTDCGTLSLSTNGVKTKTGLNVALSAGWYWAAVCSGSWTGSMRLEGIRVLDADSRAIARSIHGDPSAGQGFTRLWSAQGVFSGTGALPATFPAPGLSETGPNIWIQTSGT